MVGQAVVNSIGLCVILRVQPTDTGMWLSFMSRRMTARLVGAALCPQLSQKGPVTEVVMISMMMQQRMTKRILSMKHLQT